MPFLMIATIGIWGQLARRLYFVLALVFIGAFALEENLGRRQRQPSGIEARKKPVHHTKKALALHAPVAFDVLAVFLGQGGEGNQCRCLYRRVRSSCHAALKPARLTQDSAAGTGVCEPWIPREWPDSIYRLTIRKGVGSCIPAPAQSLRRLLGLGPEQNVRSKQAGCDRHEP